MVKNRQFLWTRSWSADLVLTFFPSLKDVVDLLWFIILIVKFAWLQSIITHNIPRKLAKINKNQGIIISYSLHANCLSSVLLNSLGWMFYRYNHRICLNIYLHQICCLISLFLHFAMTVHQETRLWSLNISVSKLLQNCSSIINNGTKLLCSRYNLH